MPVAAVLSVAAGVVVPAPVYIADVSFAAALALTVAVEVVGVLIAAAVVVVAAPASDVDYVDPVAVAVNLKVFSQ